MGTYILKINDEKTNIDYYLEWSTVVDGPISYGMSLEEFKKYYKEEYGNAGMKILEERMERVNKNGCSGRYPDDKLEDFFKFNRAGKNETRLNEEGILDKYCRVLPQTFLRKTEI